MKNIKRLLPTIAFFTIVVLLYYGMDYLTPFLKQSACFHGLAIFTSIALLPIFLLLALSKDQRPFPYGAILPRILLSIMFTSLCTGIILFGLSFWFPNLQVFSYVFMGIFVIVGIISFVLTLRADKKRAANPSL